MGGIKLSRRVIILPLASIPFILIGFILFHWGYHSSAPQDIPCEGCNVILISIDTLRADHLGTYGHFHDISPNIDNLAAKSIVFERAYSQASTTTPSHMSMFTSLYPSEHKVCTLSGFSPGCRKSLDNDTVTLAQILRQEGYVTLAYTGGANVHSSYGFDNGFDTYENAFPLDVFVKQENPFEGVLNEAGGNPFFLFLHTYKVHDPYFPEEGVRERFCGQYDGPVIDTFQKAGERILQQLKEGPQSEFSRTFFNSLQGRVESDEDPDDLALQLKTVADKGFTEESVLEIVGIIEGLVEEGGVYMFPRIQVHDTGASFWFPEAALKEMRNEIFSEQAADPENLEYLTCLYDAEILEMDKQIGQLLESLDSNGLRNNTVIIFTSDHGEEFQEHGGWLHKYLYEEILHVPLIISIPGEELSGARISSPVRSIDIMPTALGILGFEKPSGARGRSLLPMVKGTDLDRLPIFAESFPVMYAVIDSVGGENYKLIFDSTKSGKETWQLFNLDKDAAEADNIIEEAPHILEQLNATLSKHLEQGTRDILPGEIEEPQIDGELLDRLKALGYLD